MAQDLLFPIHFLCCRMAKQKGTGTRVPERKGRKLKKASAAGGLRAPAVLRGPEEACPEVGAAPPPRCESSPRTLRAVVLASVWVGWRTEQVTSGYT